MFYNKATIIGNLTRDPELKMLPSGMSVVSMSVATNHTSKKSDGTKVESVEYHNVVVFGSQAENVNRFLKKGQTVLIDGRIQTRSWEHEGRKNYRTEIIATTVQFGPKRDAGQTTASTEAQYGDDQKKADDDYNNFGGSSESNDDIDPNSIPF